MATLSWERVEGRLAGTYGPPQYTGNVFRAKVPGGWLVRLDIGGDAASLAFVPDPQHRWS